MFLQRFLKPVLQNSLLHYCGLNAGFSHLDLISIYFISLSSSAFFANPQCVQHHQWRHYRQCVCVNGCVPFPYKGESAAAATVSPSHLWLFRGHLLSLSTRRRWHLPLLTWARDASGESGRRKAGGGEARLLSQLVAPEVKALCAKLLQHKRFGYSGCVVENKQHVWHGVILFTALHPCLSCRFNAC